MGRKEEAERRRELTTIDWQPGVHAMLQMEARIKELADKVIDFEKRFAREQPESLLWEEWARELMDRLDICEKPALEDVFDTEAAQDRLGTLIEESLATSTIPRAEPLVMQSAQAFVLSVAEDILKQSQQVGILRSLTATRTSAWLKAVADALRAACNNEEEAGEDG